MFSIIEFAFLLIKARKTLDPHSRIILKRDFYENESQGYRFQSAKSLNQGQFIRAIRTSPVLSHVKPSKIRLTPLKRDSLDMPMNEPLLPKTQPRRKSWSDFIKVI